MARTEPTLPPLAVIEAALHRTTETLAREVVYPSIVAPDWSDLEWRIAEASAVVQGIGALLANRLEWRGPDRWSAFLQEQKRHTALRWQQSAQLIGRLDAAARDAGICLVGLKGVALYRLGLHPSSDRAMGDIDLLVAPQDADAAACLISTLGYREAARVERHVVFETCVRRRVVAFGEHVDHPLKIELHTRIAEQLPVSVVDITQLTLPRSGSFGINPYPSLAAVARHVLLHCANNMRARAMRFNQLYDVALLAKRMAHEDWEELLHTGVDERGLWWAFAPLVLTDRYYGGVLPRWVIDSCAAGCPALLKHVSRRHRLVDVSWSRIRIQAFPGIEWVQSPREAFAFMKSRVMPSRTALDEMHAMAVRQANFGSAQWYGISHVNRIARWLFSNPPRVQPIYPVKVALGLQPP